MMNKNSYFSNNLHNIFIKMIVIASLVVKISDIFKIAESLSIDKK